ncbi:MAG: HAD family phosphatase [Anaerolineaceae bacterium]
MKISDLAVLWDLDGTILDTMELHYLTWQETFLEAQLPFSWELFRKSFGSNNSESIRNFLGFEPSEELYQRLVNRKETLFREWLPTKANLFPGIIDWFEFLSSHGARQTIASSAPMENIQKSLDSFEIRRYFKTPIAGDTLPSKPAPDIFLAAAKSLGIEPSRCVVFEDSAQGVRSAKNAGMICAAKTGTTQFKPGDADILITDYLQDTAPVFELILNLMSKRTN